MIDALNDNTLNKVLAAADPEHEFHWVVARLADLPRGSACYLLPTWPVLLLSGTGVHNGTLIVKADASGRLYIRRIRDVEPGAPLASVAVETFPDDGTVLSHLQETMPIVPTNPQVLTCPRCGALVMKKGEECFNCREPEEHDGSPADAREPWASELERINAEVSDLGERA